MKIREVAATVVRVPLKREFRGGTYTITERCTIIVKIETDEGVTGEIYCGDEKTLYGEIRDLIVGPMKEMLIGEDPLAIESIWQRLFDAHSATPYLGRRQVATRALAAVDHALWDIFGKSLGVPLYKLLGGAKNGVPVVGYGYYDDTAGPEAVADEVLEQRALGLSGTKLKVGGSTIRNDVRRVEVIRRAVGDDFILGCDANGAWTPEEAIEFARAVEGYNVAWFEEPVRWHDEVRGMRRVREATRLPVAAGQSELSAHGCLRMMEAAAVDFLNLDASIAAGITEWRRAAAAAHLFGVRMLHHEEPQVAAHLMSAIPHSYCVEIFQDPARDPAWHEMYLGHPEVKDGMLSPPPGPGLGIEIDPKFVAKYKVE